MNKSGIMYLIVAVLTVICTSVMVLSTENSPEEEVTVTVMNPAPVTSGTFQTSTATTTDTSVTSTKKITTLCMTTTTEIITTFSETETSYVSTDTETITVSSETTVTITAETVTEQVTEEIFIDINVAGVEELTKLYGIGEVTANEIINYREQYGGFNNIEEIMNVYGIGEAKFSAIRDYIYVQNPVYPAEEVYEEPEEFPEPDTEQEIFPEEETVPPLTLDDIAPININTAGIEELMLLPHVDEQVAQDIITLREQLHIFSHVYELLYVEKLTQKQVAEIVEFVTVGQ
ncbi:MAG: helix-hairpin-helix domain-containing protein [Ruminococcus sp.]|nr:helix-hairpin-helix domain-containing protein [Ruminococcus sp.]